MLWTLWRSAPRIADRHEQLIAQGLVATVAVASVFNSFLLNHVEGLFFAWLAGLTFATLDRRGESATR